MCDFKQMTSWAVQADYSAWAGMPLAKPCRCTSVRPLAFSGRWAATSLSTVLGGMVVEFDEASSPESATWFADFEPSPARCLACSWSLFWIMCTNCLDYDAINYLQASNNTYVNQPSMSKTSHRTKIIISDVKKQVKICMRQMQTSSSKICRMRMWMPLYKRLFYQSECNPLVYAVSYTHLTLPTIYSV